MNPVGVSVKIGVPLLRSNDHDHGFNKASIPFDVYRKRIPCSIATLRTLGSLKELTTTPINDHKTTHLILLYPTYITSNILSGN